MVRKGIKKWKLSHRKKEYVLSRLEDRQDLRTALQRLENLRKGKSFTVDAELVWKELGLENE